MELKSGKTNLTSSGRRHFVPPAWYYPDPKPAAHKIKGCVAFWRGAEIEK
jgi:uncharacterized protein (DUF427 family)